MSAPDRIQPIVLVGGRSRRFGRDKLREPVGGKTGTERPGPVGRVAGAHDVILLVDRPIAALRAVFGPRVAVVGECHELVERRADARIRDRYPGVGPIGGILSAIEETGCDVFVLAGDLVRIEPSVVESVLRTADEHPRAWAVLARASAEPPHKAGGRAEPCIGLYRQPVAEALRRKLESRDGRRSLHDALPCDRVVFVDVDPELTVNVNTPDLLDR